MKKRNSLIFILVAALTAGITLLFAPNSGKITRQKMKFKAQDLKDSLDNSKENLVKDFKASYFEAVDEVEKEYELLDDRQQRLKATIASIENELTH